MNQAAYSAGRKNTVNTVATVKPPIMAMAWGPKKSLRESGIMARIAAAVETTASSTTQSYAVILPVSLSESGSATDTTSATPSVGSSVIELCTANDSLLVTIIANGVLSESGVAIDTPLSSLFTQAELNEVMTAIDTIYGIIGIPPPAVLSHIRYYIVKTEQRGYIVEAEQRGYKI